MTSRKRYSQEFRRQALKWADEPSVTDALVCGELGISTRRLRSWRDAVAEHGAEAAFPGEGKNRDDELTQLKRDLAKVKQERDFFREAARFFAKPGG
jgi:transposase